VVNRRELAAAGKSIDRFFASRVAELGAKLGPILWQFPATKQFDVQDFGKFIRLLPAGYRHALEPRHESFRDPAFVAMAREEGRRSSSPTRMPIRCSTRRPPILPTPGCRMARTTSRPDTLPRRSTAGPTQRHWGEANRDVFVYFINGGKIRPSAAATALLARLSPAP